MDEQGVIRRFQKVKVLTIEQLASLLQASIVTGRRKLKKWNVFTSINMNGRYYTLPKIFDLDKNGLWKYQNILFSKHGNLMQTITALIGASQIGLSPKQIARVLDIPANSSIFTRLPAVPGIQRERHQGRFVYFSEERYQDQKAAFSLVQSLRFASDADAVSILVEFIKHPNTDGHELSRFLSKKGIKVYPDAICNFFEYHGLQKYCGYKLIRLFKEYTDRIVNGFSPQKLFPTLPVVCFSPEVDWSSDTFTVLKTRRRKMITLDIGTFEAWETQLKSCRTGTVYTSQELRDLAPHRCTFGYDVIVHVGYALFVHCRAEREIIEDLALRNCKIRNRLKKHKIRGSLRRLIKQLEKTADKAHEGMKALRAGLAAGDRAALPGSNPALSVFALLH